MKPKLIQIYGPASSGKTTLCNYLKKITGGAIITESVREVKDVNLQEICTSQEKSKKFQFAMLLSQYKKILSSKNKASLLYCDRSLQDFAVYTKLNVKDKDFVKEYQDIVNIYSNNLANIFKTYNYQLHSVGFRDDGFRFSSNYSKECELFDNNPNLKNYTDIKEQSTKGRARIILNDIIPIGKYNVYENYK